MNTPPMPEPSFLDRALDCDCRFHDHMVCDICQIIKPAIMHYRAEAERLEKELDLTKLVLANEREETADPEAIAKAKAYLEKR